MIILTAILSFFVSNLAFCKDVATVTFLRGQVSVNDKPIKKNQGLTQGQIIKTQKRSVVRIKFIDNSTMTIGPRSKVKITKFKVGGPGVISLLKGKIRSQVEKRGNNKDKLYVQTPTAAMGVRGTDFQTTYNPITEKSSIITFDGSVSFRQINQKGAIPKSFKAYLSSVKAASVGPGMYSGTDKKLQRSTIPTRISPVQYSTLKKNKNFNETSTKKQISTRSIVPIGLSQGLFVNDHNEIKEVAKGMRIAGSAAREEKVPPPQGFFNSKTNEFAPPAGGYVSSNGDYIAPVPGQSVFDPIAQVYVPNNNFGGIDIKTGNYIPPQGYSLSDNGLFIKDNEGLKGQGPEKASPDFLKEGPVILETGEIPDFDKSYGSLIDLELQGQDFMAFEHYHHNKKLEQFEDEVEDFIEQNGQTGIPDITVAIFNIQIE